MTLYELNEKKQIDDEMLIDIVMSYGAFSKILIETGKEKIDLQKVEIEKDGEYIKELVAREWPKIYVTSLLAYIVEFKGYFRDVKHAIDIKTLNVIEEHSEIIYTKYEYDILA